MEKADNTTLSREELAVYMEESIVSVTSAYEQSPMVLMVDDAVIGTLGNFSASIGKAKSKKTFNVSAIVASALRGSTILHGLHSPKINGWCYTLTRNKDGIIVKTY